MTLTREPGLDSLRVVAQFLEGGAASAAISPDAAVACLRRALAILPITDVCLGWRLPDALVEAVAGEARAGGARAWLWHPLLSGDGHYVPAADAARGPGGTPVPWPGGLSEFAFDCPVRRSGLAAALGRLDRAMTQTSWDGVFLDKIRWPSPTRDPAADLACFCDSCRARAEGDDIDLAAVSAYLAQSSATADGRIDLLAQILGVVKDGPLAGFLAWRCEMVTHAVREAAGHVSESSGPGGEPMRVALDVFTPSLALAVGQDIAALAPLGDFTKAMTYLGTHGPAGLPYELCRLARWLSEGGVGAPVACLGEMLGYAIGSEDDLCRGTLGAQVLARELEALVSMAADRSAAGIDAIELEGLAVLDDEALLEAVRIAVARRTGIVLAWDLWSMPPARLEVLTEALPTGARDDAPARAPGGDLA